MMEWHKSFSGIRFKTFVLPWIFGRWIASVPIMTETEQGQEAGFIQLSEI